MKHPNVNHYRNGIMGVGFFVVLHDGQDDFANEKFFTVVFDDQVDLGGKFTGYVATFRLSDLNFLSVPVDSVDDAVSAWQPEWAFDKAKVLIDEYLAELRGPVKYYCPRCSATMEEVGMAKRLRCENEECSA